MAPAVVRTATPAATHVVRSKPRRLSPLLSASVESRSWLLSSMSLPSAVRMIGSFTPMCTMSAPIATQPTA